MKSVIFLLVLLALPLTVFADALATSMCVLDKATLDKLVLGHGTLDKIPTAALWAAALSRDFPGDACAVSFRWADKPCQVLLTRQEGRVIYSITQNEKDKPPRLVCVGEIENKTGVHSNDGTETVFTNAKKNWAKDPLIVVLRGGNFLTR